jgi:energy-coupling factor transporter transmembrane protein EcfT
MFVQYHIIITILFLISIVISFFQKKVKMPTFWRVLTFGFVLFIFIFWTVSVELDYFYFFEVNFYKDFEKIHSYVFDFLSFLI